LTGRSKLRQELIESDGWYEAASELLDALEAAEERERVLRDELACAWDDGVMTAMHHARASMPDLLMFNPYRAALAEGTQPETCPIPRCAVSDTCLQECGTQQGEQR
jgi:hypothetical protein